MAEAYIVSAARTAGGRRDGRVSGWHPVDLGGAILDAVVARAGVPGAAIEDVIFGCVTQVGEQSNHIGRNAVLASGLPESVPAVSIDRQCGSSQQAVHFAAQAVMSGTQDLVIAAGAESMSRAPMGSSGRWSKEPKPGSPSSPGLLANYPKTAFSQFIGAEMIAEK
jgi:acetyl-CoA C-acetyltransferase